MLQCCSARPIRCDLTTAGCRGDTPQAACCRPGADSCQGLGFCPCLQLLNGIASVAADAGGSSELGYEYIFAMFDVYPIPGRAAPDVAVSPQCCWKILHKIMIHNNCKSHGSKAEQGRNSDQNKNQVKTQIQITRSHKLWRIRETFLVPPLLHLTPPPAPGEGCAGDVRQCVRQSTFHFNLSVVNFYELAWPRLAQDRATCSNTLTICTRGVNKISRSISQ